MPAKDLKIKFCGFHKIVYIPEHPNGSIDQYDCLKRKFNGVDVYKVQKGVRLEYRGTVINVPESNVTFFILDDSE